MNALELLQDLAGRGVVLTPHGRKLLVKAPAGTLRAVDRKLLSRLKPALLAILEASRTPGELPPDWRELWEERAAIREFDGGLDREQAEALALADVWRLMERAGKPDRDHA
jgi:hypothetical protein